MNKLDILRGLISSVLKIPEDAIGLEDGIQKTPGWDSLAHVSIMVGIEREFGVEIDERLMNCRTVAELLDSLPD